MRIGFVCLPVTGHLNPMSALAAKLLARGHQPAFFGIPDAEAIARDAGLDFVAICADAYPAGSVARIWGPIRDMHGMDVMRYAGEHIQPDLLAHGLRELPRAFQDHGIEAAVFDTAYIFAELAAMKAGIPYAQAWLVLNFDPTGATPPCTFDWPLDGDERRLERNLHGVSETFAAFYAPCLSVARAFAEDAGLAIDLGDPGATASRLAIVSQMPAEFDYPDIPWPPQFHYTGPYSPGRGASSVSFPWERLTGAPLIYASLGTVVNGCPDVYRAILGTARRMPDHQFVLTVGAGVSVQDLGPVPQNAVLVAMAPQLELLKQARLCITHAGLNTVLECLAEGVPMIAVPIAYDQPGVAARIAHHGVGEFIPLHDISEDRLFRSATRVVEDGSYRAAAERLKDVIARKDGLGRAADVIEAALAPSAVARGASEARPTGA